MHALIDAVAASILLEVDGADDWLIRKFDPTWRDPSAGKVLSIYAMQEYPSVSGDQFATGYSEDAVDLLIEYAEPTNEILVVDEAAYLNLYETSDALKAWARNHQTFAGWHQFEYVRTTFNATQRLEAFVRFFQMTFTARRMADYGAA